MTGLLACRQPDSAEQAEQEREVVGTHLIPQAQQFRAEIYIRQATRFD